MVNGLSRNSKTWLAAKKGPLRVVEVEVPRAAILRATFDDGTIRDVDFSEIIARSKWFHALAASATFETVEIINNGRALQWITGTDYCADALRMLGDEQLAGKGAQ
jgi:hypothetical protein